jgi:hypothetical protein
MGDESIMLCEKKPDDSAAEPPPGERALRSERALFEKTQEKTAKSGAKNKKFNAAKRASPASSHLVVPGLPIRSFSAATPSPAIMITA